MHTGSLSVREFDCSSQCTVQQNMEGRDFQKLFDGKEKTLNDEIATLKKKLLLVTSELIETKRNIECSEQSNGTSSRFEMELQNTLQSLKAENLALQTVVDKQNTSIERKQSEISSLKLKVSTCFPHI